MAEITAEIAVSRENQPLDLMRMHRRLLALQREEAEECNTATAENFIEKNEEMKK
jgi:hypothetical protein